MKKTTSTIIVTVSFIASVLGILAYYQNNTLIDLNGEWLIEDKVIKGPYKDSVILFKAYITHKGTTFSGEAEKISLNGEEISNDEKSRLELVNGVIESNIIRVNFIEHGKNRETRGQFLWNVIDNDDITGTFSSTTLARGKSRLYKQ